MLLGIYGAIPGLRPLLASVRGYQLRSWRYGPETERLVEAAWDRETWSPCRLRDWQQEQLARALDGAARQVPYYRAMWAARRRRGDRTSWECVGNWPPLEKAAIRENPHGFLADNPRQRRYRETTSGTSGQPIPIWYGRDTARAWYALVEARWRGWYGVSRRDRWALVGSQLVTPVGQDSPPFWVWNRGLQQLYLSAYHLSQKSLPYYLDALAAHRVRYLWGHSSALTAMAREALRAGRTDLRMHVVVSSAEPLRPQQRRVIGQAFACPVRESYGMSEMAAGASECEDGRMHLWPEVGWLEVLDSDRPVSPGEPGDLVSTTFLNSVMPLVRYRIGDIGALPAGDEICPCGRSLPQLPRIEGRVSDVLYTRDGRQISPGAVEAIFDTDLPFLEGQLIQESLGRVRICYVPWAPLSGSQADELVDRVRRRLGDVEVQLEAVAEIPRGAGGKFRAVLCRIPEEERTGTAGVQPV